MEQRVKQRLELLSLHVQSPKISKDRWSVLNDLNLELALTVVATLSTILIPVIGWYLRRKECHQLDVVLDKGIFLVNQLAGNLKKFSIVIDEKPASDQVAWITGWIINSGNFDISKRMIEHPLILKLPNNMKWLRGSIEHCSNDVECHSQIVGDQELQFEWILLKCGEFINFDALLQCPLEETEQFRSIYSLVEIVRPYSRIENIQIESLIPLPQLGERYSPLKPRKLNLIPKLSATIATILFLVPMWVITFFPFELDNLIGDGFLPATPKLVKTVDGIPVELKVSVNQKNEVRLIPNQPEVDTPLHDNYLFSSTDELFSQEDIRVGRIAVRELSKDTSHLFILGFLTSMFTWGLLYMWFPRMFLFDSNKRRTTSALFKLQTQKIAKQSKS